MSMPLQIPGFVWGTVVNNLDPLGMGRALIRIDGMFEPHHPEWAFPLGWPGAGHPDGGSKYTPKLEAQVAVIFEGGDPTVAPGFLTGPYGASIGIPDGPSIVQEAYLAGASNAGVNAETIVEQFEAATQAALNGESAEAGTLSLEQAAAHVNYVNVIWEDDAFIMFFVNDPTNLGDKRFVLVEKLTKSRIVFNATDGAQGKSVTLELVANTSISIASKGVVDIRGGSVQIQGRRVATKPGVTTI